MPAPRDRITAVAEYDAMIHRVARQRLDLQARDMWRMRQEIGRFLREARTGLGLQPYQLNREVAERVIAGLHAQAEGLARSLTGIVEQASHANAEHALALGHSYAQHFGAATVRLTADARVLAVALEHSARLISIRDGGLTSRIQRQVDSAIRRAVLSVQVGGGEGAMAEITRALTGVKRWSYEAERIYRTEVGRVYSMVTDQSGQQLDQIIPTGKRWRWSRISREEHAQIDGQTVGARGRFRVPLRRGGVVRMRFPRDPVAPAEATVNCGCGVVLVPLAHRRRRAA